MLGTNPEAVLSLLATVFTGLLAVLMVNETRCMAAGTDPMTDQVHAMTHHFPRATYALAVVIGLVLGHLFWP